MSEKLLDQKLWMITKGRCNEKPRASLNYTTDTCDESPANNMRTSPLTIDFLFVLLDLGKTTLSISIMLTKWRLHHCHLP